MTDSPFQRAARPQIPYLPQEPPRAIVRERDKVPQIDLPVKVIIKGRDKVLPRANREEGETREPDTRSPWKVHHYFGKLGQPSGNYRFFISEAFKENLPRRLLTIEALNEGFVMIKKESSDNERDILSKIRHPGITNIQKVFMPKSGNVYISLDPCPYTLQEFIGMKLALNEEEVHLIAKSVSS